ncbi:MAG: TetR family transcriptional regulator [Sterolibacterium sp.]|jgi:AcrR family transcriptional regulator|nr:TetR family transcriptional regulator [Sterolibacterium sp.]
MPEIDHRDTRERILRTAEMLFIEHGFEATTLRQITGKAGVNLAAVNYHFGSKDLLIEEVFRQRLGWLNEQCLLELDRLESEAAGAPLRTRQILEAFFGVALKLAADKESGGNNFMRLLGRTYTAPTPFVREFLAREYAAAVPRFKAALFKSLPDVPKEEILWRFHFMLGAMSYAISGSDALNVLGGLDDSNTGALHARLMSFLIGGLRAPLPELQTGQTLPRTSAAKQFA